MIRADVGRREDLDMCLYQAGVAVLGGNLDRGDVWIWRRPEREQFGDWTTNVAMQVFSRLEPEKKKLYQSPLGLAEKIADKLKDDTGLKSFLERIEILPPDFINLYLNNQSKVQLLAEMVTKSREKIIGRRVIVEYSSPNIAKPFTVGHLRSTVIGQAVANLLEATGWRVYRDNHLGDWGTQFGKQVVAIEKWGNWEEIEQSETPIRELVALYVKFHQEAEKDSTLEEEARQVFAQMEQGNEKYLSLWQKIIDLSMKEFGRIYDYLGVHFTENDGLGYGESFVRDKTDGVVQELREKGLLRESQGAQVVDFPDEKNWPAFLILKQDGSTLYQTRDLAMDKWRRETYGPEIKVINEVGREQSLYFQQLYRLEERLGWYRPGQRVHVGHGLYRFKDRKMSTRRGDVVWLDDLLREIESKVAQMSKEQLSENDKRIIAAGALVWNDVSREPMSDIAFDFQAMLNLKGNSGPYMQYTAVRVQSVLQKGENEPVNGKKLKELINREKIEKILRSSAMDEWSDDEMRLVGKLLRYNEVVWQAADNLAPYVLANYLYEVAQEFNNFYAQSKIVGDERRMTLTAVVGLVLSDGLGILGIQIPSKM